MIDVIVPTVPGREDSLERLQVSLTETTSNVFRWIVVEDSRNCGWGWKKGLERSRSGYVLLCTDDQEYLVKGWDTVCIDTVDEGRLPCPRVTFPDGTFESQGGDMNAFRHVSPTPKRDGTSVDYTTIPFCSREQIERIGMIEVQYCCDVWVSYRGRQLGIETVLRHGFDVRHWHEQAGRGAGMEQGERDAMDEATMRKELARVGSLRDTPADTRSAA